jgi:hypothetical protein
VWGTDPDAVKSLKTWLLKQRIPLIDDVKLNQLASEMGLHQPVSNPDVLKLSKTLGAKQVIFVDADVYKSQGDDIAVVFRQAPVYKVSLFIRALNAETGEIDWSGKAQSTESFTNLSDGIHQLTCDCVGFTRSWKGGSAIRLSARTECYGEGGTAYCTIYPHHR